MKRASSLAFGLMAAIAAAQHREPTGRPEGVDVDGTDRLDRLRGLIYRPGVATVCGLGQFAAEIWSLRKISRLSHDAPTHRRIDKLDADERFFWFAQGRPVGTAVGGPQQGVRRHCPADEGAKKAEGKNVVGPDVLLFPGSSAVLGRQN